MHSASHRYDEVFEVVLFDTVPTVEEAGRGG